MEDNKDYYRIAAISPKLFLGNPRENSREIISIIENFVNQHLLDLNIIKINVKLNRYIFEKYSNIIASFQFNYHLLICFYIKL